MTRRRRRPLSTCVRVSVATAAMLLASVATTVAVGDDQPSSPTGRRVISRNAALAADASGEEIYRQACATCHAADGTGSPEHVVGFALPLENGHDVPDFTDCPTNTKEPKADWMAVAQRGGPIRGLDRHMPAFGDALTPDQIERVVRHLWTFCTDASWPRGDLNPPRAFFTEKAFPENEAILISAVGLGSSRAVRDVIVFERRFGTRGTWELNVPIGARQTAPGGSWVQGLGDIELSARRTVHANNDAGRIFSVGTSSNLPTGKQELGLGNGYTTLQPFLLGAQLLGDAGFVQFHTGYRTTTARQRAPDQAFIRVATGYTFAQDGGVGRAWTPMLETITVKPLGHAVQFDVVPQMQVSLSKLQHVLLNVGVRVPVSSRAGRPTQLMTYILWDWFDGGFTAFWK